MPRKILEVKNLKVSFLNETSGLQIIRGFDIDLWEAEIVGILGESGSGKTIATSSILKLFDDDDAQIDDGKIIFEGTDITVQSEKQLRQIRGKEISYVFQNSTQALHPYKRIGRQMVEHLKLHGLDYSKQNVLDAMSEVGLSDAEIIYDKFPSRLSAGQNQRIMIAGCILSNPKLLIADEPTSSIDASLRKKILDIFLNVNKKYKTSMIVVTHDFDIVKYLCSRLVIMYGGLSIEQGSLSDVLKMPLHPYTEELIKCASSLSSGHEILHSLEGAPLTPQEFESICPFYSRCSYRQEECLERVPEPIEIGNRTVRCIDSVIKMRTASEVKGAKK